MELVLVTPNSPEWDFMWKWLEANPINKDLPEPTIALNENEAWQYMGSFKQDTRVIHQFRHRNHPILGNVKNLSVSASHEFTNEQISKKFRL